jgi:hypothetical protein
MVYTAGQRWIEADASGSASAWRKERTMDEDTGMDVEVDSPIDALDAAVVEDEGDLGDAGNSHHNPCPIS